MPSLFFLNHLRHLRVGCLNHMRHINFLFPGVAKKYNHTCLQIITSRPVLNDMYNGTSCG